jgi:hypothetical protein
MRTVPTSIIGISYDPSPVQENIDPVDDKQPTLEGTLVPQPDPLADDAEQLPDDPDFREPDEPQNAPEPADGTKPTEAPATDDPAAPVKRGRGRPRKNV